MYSVETPLNTAEIERALEGATRELGGNTEPVEDRESTEPTRHTDEIDKKRETLLRLAESGDIDKSVAYIKKASKKIVDKLYEEHERKQLRRTNEFITDAIISKFSETLGGLDAIESPEELAKELEKDELLKRDVYRVVETVSPYIPLVGFFTGGITTIKHVNKHKVESEEPQKPS